MGARWKETALSVVPPSYQMADTDKVALNFAAGEVITGATARLRDLQTLEELAVPAEDVEIEEQGALVTVSGLVRNNNYELAVTFVRADTTSWTRTLVLEVVA